MSKSRFEAFSDGVFAIIITIIVLGITFPSDFSSSKIHDFAWEIFIFIEGGLIVGQYWYTHSDFFDKIDVIPVESMLFNVLFLLSLALVPLFTKGIMQNPNETFPIVGFVVDTLVASMLFYISAALAKRGKQLVYVDNLFFRIASTIFVIIIGIIALFAPQIASTLFVIFPIAGLVVRLWDKKVKRYHSKS